eukprot:4276369-Prymnesium_polylepis.1
MPTPAGYRVDHSKYPTSCHHTATAAAAASTSRQPNVARAAARAAAAPPASACAAANAHPHPPSRPATRPAVTWSGHMECVLRPHHQAFPERPD